MKNFSAKKRAAVLSAVLLLGAAAASGKTIGDFRQLDQWSGLTAAELTAPNGDPAAVLPAGGTAVFEYTEHKTFLSGRAVDFSDMLDAVCVEDWYDYRYLECWVNLPNADPVDLECTVIPLAVGRPDYAESLASTLRVQGEGWQRVVFPLHDFDYVRHQGAHWKHIHGLKISASGNEDALLISQPRLKKSRLVALGAAVKSKPVKAGETAVYDLQLENESAAVRTVSLVLEHTGWEACPAALSETELSLQPWETKNVTLSVRMNELVAPGGRELRKITAIPDGRGDLKEELSVITVRELPHPYLMHTEAGWAAVRQKAEAVEWAKAAKQEYIEKARNWRVPAARAKGDYSFNHKAGGDAETCAVAWNLSGDDALAQKVIRYLRAFSDPETGYPATARNSGAFVHRGMFFMHTARAYDLVYDHPSLTAADHANMEASMRLFNGWVDYMLKTGDGNNHQDGLSAGALMNSLVMQDFEQAERFLYGTGGLLDLIGQGVLDDGQYFEGTAN
ncbi:hypothetical protein [Pontiella sp.]|uniref:COG1470 family protein n=1 Tax=Pontiella sp. TaxID=2837462 RepID=UPI00356712BC